MQYNTSYTVLYCIVLDVFGLLLVTLMYAYGLRIKDIGFASVSILGGRSTLILLQYPLLKGKK